MFRKDFYIDFFYKHILVIDMVNEAIKELIANNGGNKKVIASKLGITPQFLGQLERGERKKPSAELAKKIREVYGIDVFTNKPTNETVVSRETHKTLSIREDVWGEIKTSNEFYRSQNSEMLTMLKMLIQGGTVPKNT